MKRMLDIIVLASTLSLVGCQGLSDFMKYPPGPERLWSKKGVSIEEMRSDRKACHDYAHKLGIELAGDRLFYTEACMLKKSYTFTNYRSRDTADYCSKDWYSGGPACKSVGR
jgi:hypothetical protein